MIRINKTLPTLDKLAEKHYTILRKEFHISQILNKKIQETTGDAQQYFKLIQKNLKQIIIGRPEILQKQAIKLRKAYEKAGGARQKGRKEKDNKVKQKTLEVFCYNSFIKDQNPKKNNYAYDLAEKLNVPVCLYCNRQHTTTIRTTSKRTRPEFDHFIDKKRHPYLALSFYNLIPSCSVCNSPGIKGTNKFMPSENLHPYIEDADDTYAFQTGIIAADYVQGKVSDFEIKIEPRLTNKNKEKEKRAMANVKAFALEKLYEKNKDYAAGIIRRCHIYNSSMRSEIESLFGNLSKQEFKEAILGNYIRIKYLGLQPLAKLTKDLAEELKIDE